MRPAILLSTSILCSSKRAIREVTSKSFLRYLNNWYSRRLSERLRSYNSSSVQSSSTSSFTPLLESTSGGGGLSGDEACRLLALIIRGMFAPPLNGSIMISSSLSLATLCLAGYTRCSLKQRLPRGHCPVSRQSGHSIFCAAESCAKGQAYLSHLPLLHAKHCSLSLLTLTASVHSLAVHRSRKLLINLPTAVRRFEMLTLFGPLVAA